MMRKVCVFAVVAAGALGASAAEVSVAETHGDVNAAVARAVAAGGGRASARRDG